jgi:hypothetical protein
VFQQTSEWCWAAVSEMALRYFNEPNLNPFGNYQCGVIGVAGKIGVLPPFCQFDCTSCIVPISSAANLTIVLQRYPLEVQSAGLGGRSISATAGGVLSFQQVESSIVAGHPVVAGVTPIGIPSPLGPAHATLIVGFDTTTSTRQGIYVNDPFPYGLGPLGPYGDPYLLNGARFTGLGQYLIDYSTFLARLSWTEGIVIQ